MSKVLRHALWPWWTLQLATSAKSFLDNPVIGSRRLNEAGLHVGRLKLAHAMAWSRRRRLAHLISTEDQAAFDRDGFVVRESFLPSLLFAQLREQIADYHGPARKMIQGDTMTRRIALDPALLAAVPQARRLLRDPVWRGLIRYAGATDSEPLNYIQTIMARHGDGPDDPQQALHADTFHPTVKAWLFLTDVNADDGPLTYVAGSHRLTSERLAWERAMSYHARDAERLTARGSFRIERDALTDLRLPQPHVFAVPANTLVVADTFGFHARGPSDHASMRVEIWAYGRRNPFLPWCGLDPMSLPGIAERRVPAMWQFHDRYERWIGQPWQDAGLRGAFDPG